MPSDPRVPTEPTLEELSAFIDNELDAAAQARVAEHVAGCQGCEARLDGLRQTAHAIRSLPMETPPRTFTIPAQRRQAWRWAPVGWIGSGAVALLLIAVGIHNLHLPAGTPASSGSTANYNATTAVHKSSGAGAAAPVGSAPSQALDAQRFASANAATAVDPIHGRRMILVADQASYSSTGQIKVTIELQGSPSTSTSSGDQGLTLTLVRNGTGVALHPVGVISYDGSPVFGGTYDLASLPLAEPSAGDYRLEATWVIPDGWGRVLQTSVPIRIAG